MGGKLRLTIMVLMVSGSSVATAADTLKYAAPPAWVVPVTVPTSPNAPPNAPAAILLQDQQMAIEPGKITAYTETAVKIQNSQGLAVGNLSIQWQPATDSVTVNKLVIRRGSQVIDVLKSGQTFTVVRRESNLEIATLDGTLTANIQPEGLQVGDIVDLATTVERVDPVLKGHIQTKFADWNGMPITLGRARISWPKSMKVQILGSTGLPPLVPKVRDGMALVELSQSKIEPLILPKDAPARFKTGRLAEVSDFGSWSEVAELMAPLYREAAVVPASGPLRAEVEKIRKATNDPKARAEQALQLVQDRVRYVALLMGQGGYVPASAESTWSRRFGDCKAKTALLLAILHEFGINAEAVAVNSSFGDAIADRLPMVGQFDHVLVRASIAGKTYWLDGTRTGDLALDSIDTPNFGWGLPLVAQAALVRIVPGPLQQPELATQLFIDAREGVYVPAPARAEQIYRGDTAVMLNAAFSSIGGSQLDEVQREYWKRQYDFITLKSAGTRFDKLKRELHLSMIGEAKLEWDDGWFYVPGSTIAFEPDFERTAGQFRDAPIQLSYPSFNTTRVEIRLPPGFVSGQAEPKLPVPIRETLAGNEYSRTVSFVDGVMRLEASERSIVPEIPYKEALAAQGRLKALNDEDVHLKVPSSYRPTSKDVQASMAAKPQSAQAFIDRGVMLLKQRKYDEAIADFSEAVKLDPKNAWAFANRGLTRVWTNDHAGAIPDLAAAEAIQPNNSVLLRARALMAEQKGDYTAALEAYSKAHEADRTSDFSLLRRAGIHMRLGKYDLAMKEIETILGRSPRDTSALAQRALLHANTENWSAAEKDVATVLAADPKNPEALLAKAGIAMSRRNYDQALATAEQILAIDPDNHMALAMQAQLLKRSGNQDRARKTLDEAINRRPKDATTLLNRAHAGIEAKDFEAADRDIAAALAAEPNNPYALQAKASVALARGDYKAAVAALTNALSRFPTNGPMLASRASAYRELREYERALEDTEAALRTGLVSPQLRLLRINILVVQGQLERAAAETDLLVKENPTADYALVAAGKAYSTMGMKDRAMDVFAKALAIKPMSYIYVNRSQVRPFADFAGRLSDLDAALKLEPTDPSALGQKAELLLKQGRPAEAIALYDQAMKTELDPDDWALSRAIALYKAGRTAEANRAFDAERSKAKTSSDWSRLCWGKAVFNVLLKSALQDCERALRLDPNNRSISESLGLVYLKLDDRDAALKAYDKAVSERSGATALMGRAIAYARKGDKARAASDAAQARKLRPRVDDMFAEYGLASDLVSLR